MPFLRAAEVNSLPPGRGRTVHVGGRELALWHLDGQFWCLDDACPHRGASLGAGTLENGAVHCPLHGWGFDPRSGACLNRPDRPVRTHPTRVVDGWVEIDIDGGSAAGQTIPPL